MPEPLSGGCLCGGVRYVVDAPVQRLAACYCSDCQRMTSADRSINALVPAAAFRLVKGQTKVFTKVADSGNALARHFCPECGSWIFNPLGGNPAYLVLKAGTFDRHEGLTIELNLWAASRPAWASIDRSIETRDRQ